MDQNERQVIDGLFGKLRQVEQQAPQRDPEAEAHIRQQVAAQPGAPYYMAQAMLVQEQALGSLQSRLQELERELAARPAAAGSGGGGGFLSGLFGGGQPQPARPAPRPMAPVQAAPGYGSATGMGQGGGHGAPWGGGGGAWGGGRPGFGGGGGGGFLASAMTTAVGVAGGMLVADALSNAFSGGEEALGGLAEGASDVADQATAPFEDPGVQDAAAAPEEVDAGGYDAGGGFDEEAI